MSSTEGSRLSLLTHPYHELAPLQGGRAQLKSAARRPGSALVWAVDSRDRVDEEQMVRRRPGGLSLLAVLPTVEDIVADPTVIHRVQSCRPHGILPGQRDPNPGDLAQVLRRPPHDLGGEVTDYLSWRGFAFDRATKDVIRTIIKLSEELRSISAVSRGMYLSRRALGRRLTTSGLPAPSHWLQIARVLRLVTRLQNTEASVFSMAYAAGYPDGFSASNQMQRLIGHRPSQARQYLGWEWIGEAWIRREVETGGLAPNVAMRLHHDGPRPHSPRPGRRGRPHTLRSPT